MVAHLVCILFTGFLVYTSQPGSSLFSWHPTLMSLAFGFLMAQAVLIFSPHSSLFPCTVRKVKVRLHWILNLSALVAASAGTVAIFYKKWQRGKDHFTSWHGFIGIITFAYLAMQCLAGIMPLYPHLFRNYIRLVDLKRYHATSGMLLTFLVTASLVLGMQTNWFTANVTGTSWYACALCPVMIALVISQQVSQQYLRKSQDDHNSQKAASFASEAEAE